MNDFIIKRSIGLGQNFYSYHCELWREVFYDGMLMDQNIDKFTMDLKLHAINNSGNALIEVAFSNIRLDKQALILSFLGKGLKKLLNITDKLLLEVSSTGNILNMYNHEEIERKWQAFSSGSDLEETIKSFNDKEKIEFIKHGNIQFRNKKQLLDLFNNSILFRFVFEEFYGIKLVEGVPVDVPQRLVESILLKGKNHKMDFEFMLMKTNEELLDITLIGTLDTEATSIDIDDLEDEYYLQYEGIDDFESYTFDYTAMYCINRKTGQIKEASGTLHENFNDEKLKGEINLYMKQV